MKPDTVKRFLPLVIIAVAVLVMIYMVKHRVKPERAEVSETVVPAEILPVVFETMRIRIPAQGTVTPAVQVSIKPEVNGRIVEVSSNLVPGGRFRKGELLFRIDSRDYEARAASQRQVLAGAELTLKQEQARARVAEREWKLLNSSVDSNAADRELTLRIPQVKQAEATLEAARINLDKAMLDLERCTVRAPFNGLVIRESVDPGQVVSSQSEAVMLAGSDKYWVRVSVPMEHLRFIQFPGKGIAGSETEIIQDTGNGDLRRSGSVVRLMGDMAEAGRLARLLVAISDPTVLADDHDLPLLIGSFVNVNIMGRELTGVVRIPRQALHTEERGAAGQIQSVDVVWIMNGENRLAVRDVTVEWRTENQVFIHNSLKAGERLIVSNIGTPIEGMKLVETGSTADVAEGSAE